MLTLLHILCPLMHIEDLILWKLKVTGQCHRVITQDLHILQITEDLMNPHLEEISLNDLQIGGGRRNIQMTGQGVLVIQGTTEEEEILSNGEEGRNLTMRSREEVIHQDQGIGTGEIVN